MSTNQSHPPQFGQSRSNHSMMSAHSGRSNQSPSLNQHNSNNSRNANKPKGNRPHKKEKIGQMTKEEKKRLWEQLASYSLTLIEQAAEAKSRGQKIKYNHSPEINALFEKCGLRAPKNGKGAERLHENFMKKIKLLNPSSKKKESAPKKQRWQPKGGIMYTLRHYLTIFCREHSVY